jgi:hypothetical protein
MAAIEQSAVIDPEKLMGSYSGRSTRSARLGTPRWSSSATGSVCTGTGCRGLA